MTAPNKMAKRAAAGTLALAVCLTGGVIGAGAANAAPGFKFDQRISGVDRTATSIAAAEAGFAAGSDTVIIVERDAVVDGLTASYAAGLNKAPILYVNRQGVPDNVAAEIKKLGATKAILVGGKAVLPQAVEDQLKSSNLTVTRLSGPDRYATAADVALSGSKTPDKVLVASGEVPADALAAGPVAYAKNFPLVLVRPDSVPDSSRDALDKLGSGERLAIGGTVRISASVYDSLGQSKRRVSGANRQATAINLANIATGELGFAKDRVALVSDADRAAVDALVASPVAGSNLAPLLFISGSSLGSDTEKYLKDNAAALTGPGYIFGGTAAVPQAAADAGTTAAGGGEAPPTTGNQKYSFSGSAGATVVSLATDDPTTTADERTQGNVQYRITGLGDAPVNVVLVDPDSVKVDANGRVTFLSTGTTGRADLTAAAAGYISVLNGVATGTTNKAANNITSVGGTLSLTVNSTTPGALIPVVFSNADKNSVLELDSTTTGSTVYGVPTGDFGIGAQINYQSAAATTANYTGTTGVATSGTISELTVTSVDSAAKTFQATYTTGDGTNAIAASGTFTYGVAGSTYTAPGGTQLSEEQFTSFIGKSDVLNVNYNASGPSNFAFTKDVPAAATNVNAVVNDQDNNGTIDSIKVTFTAAPNLSATGYQVQRATVSMAGVTGSFSDIAGAVVDRNAAKEYVDTTAVAGTSYKYRVFTQPGSATTTQSMASDAVKAPTSAIQGAVAGAPTLLDIRATETGTGNFQVGAGDSLQVIFNEPVTVPNGSAFRLSDGVNSATLTIDGTNARVLALPAGTYNGQTVVAGQGYRIQIVNAAAISNPNPAATTVGYPAAIVASTAGVVDLDEGNTLSLASGDRAVDVSAFSPAYNTTAPTITSGTYNATTRTATFASDVALSPSTVDASDFKVVGGTKAATSATVSNGGLTVSVVLSETGTFGNGDTVTSDNNTISTIDGIAGIGTSVVTG